MLLVVVVVLVMRRDKGDGHRGAPEARRGCGQGSEGTDLLLHDSINSRRNHAVGFQEQQLL